MSEEPLQTMPPAPEEGIDPDRVAAAEERWEACPLRDCKRKPELLYEDFYLRDVRTNRLMCSACAVRTEVGYLAREVVKASDDRFFQGTLRDDLLIFLVTLALSTVVNALMLLIGFWLLGFIVGGAAGAGIARLARRLTQRRVSRNSAWVAIGGLVVGALLSPIPRAVFGGYVAVFFIEPSVWLGQALNLTVIITTVAMAMTAYGIFMRRI